MMSKIPFTNDHSTVMTTLEDGIESMAVQAEFFDASIPLDALAKLLVAEQIIHRDPLLTREMAGSYSVVFKSGAVIFWNCSPTLIRAATDRIQRVVGELKSVEDVRDTYAVLLGKDSERVNFRDVWLPKLSVEHIKVISECMARSIALDRCEQNVSEALQKISPVVARLRSTGALATSPSVTLRTIGFTMSIRETILGKLGLFDDPPEAWQSETMAKLFEQLNLNFDIQRPVESVQAKLEYLADLNLILSDLLQSRQSHRLEWIVILLIVVEVILGLIGFFRGAH